MEILLKMIPVSERLPEDKQKVLIDTGSSVDPAQYNKETGMFNRYNNWMPGELRQHFFYSGVLSWCPFPEPSGRAGFIAEPEPAPNYRDWLDSTGMEEPFRDGKWAEPCDNPAADIVRDQGCK